MTHACRSRLLAVSCVLIAYCFPVVPFAHAAVTDWQKGANIVPESTVDFASADFLQSLQDLAAMHANYVSLVVPYYQTDIHTTDIAPGWNTPTDASLVTAITASHALGLHVMLTLHVETNDGNWRANINPADHNAWFAAYGNVLMHLATLAEAQGVEELCIGSELIKMTSPGIDPTNTTHWKSMIASVRSLFTGKLLYSANHGGSGIIDEKNTIGFWPDLDIIGLSAYHPLSQNDIASVSTMVQAWSDWNANEIHALQQTYGKPVIFTEVGYRSVQGAHKDPSNWSMQSCIDVQEQVRDYESLFLYWTGDPAMQGIFLWDWKSHVPNDALNTFYTPQKKPAQDLIAQWFHFNIDFPRPNGFPDPNPPLTNCSTQGSGQSSSLLDDTSSSLTSSSSSQSSSSSAGNIGGTSSSSSSQDNGGGGTGGGGGGMSSVSPSSQNTNGSGTGGGTGGSGGGNGNTTGGNTGGGGAGGGGGGSPPQNGGIPPPAFGGGQPVIPLYPPAAGRGALPPDFSGSEAAAVIVVLAILFFRRKLFA